MRKAIALISGGLDSALAIRLIQEQGIEVIALNVLNVFDDLESAETSRAQATARRLGVRLRVAVRGPEYVELIRKPVYGFGSGANPCIDCRIHLLGLAWEIAQEEGASFLVSGEVVGQRPMSQLKYQIKLINRRTGLGDYVVRPLTAKRLDPTLPEREGWVDRERLLGISGRSRRQQLDLAKQWGLEDIASGAGGCLLTDPIYSRKVFDLYKHREALTRDDYRLLTIGRHFRPDADTKLVVGRHEKEADILETMLIGQRLLVVPEDFNGPSVMLDGPETEENRERVLKLVRAYTRQRQATDSPERLLRIMRAGKPDEIIPFVWSEVPVGELDAWRVT